jgi:serine protease Do
MSVTTGKEFTMNKKALHLAAVILIPFIIAVLVVSLEGCKKKEIGSEVTGLPRSFADIVVKVKPAVVNISTITTVKIPGSPFRHFFSPEERDPFSDFFHRFFGDIPDREMKQQSLGSGFIIDKDGYIITNNHVVEGAEEIKVKLADGREFKAKVAGRDPKTDLALIKISSLFKNLPVLLLGDSDRIRVGDWVLAVGNPFGLEHTVTQGIISATGRVIGSGPYDNFLQTDAPINPGNSGGPLVNMKGEVIGINTAIMASGQGIGFAIPSNMAKTVVSQIREKGKVVRGWIGVSVQTVTPEMAQAFGLKDTKGALVGEVVPGGPAEAAGIKRGDVIISFDGKTVSGLSDLPVAVAETPVGKSAEVKVIREGKEFTLTIQVAEMPEGRIASAPANVPKGNLGISIDNINPRWRAEFKIRDRSGVVITDIAPDSPAAEAGLQSGDVIKEVNRKPVNNINDYHNIVAETKGNRPLLFLIKRGGQTFFVSIKTP